MLRIWASLLTSIHLLLSKGYGQGTLRTKYREWLEDNDRVEVRSWYGEAAVQLSQNWSFDFTGTIDAWSGATPNGLPPTATDEQNPTEWLNFVPQEIRKAGLFTVSKRSPDYDLQLEYGISDEPDYFSNSYAVRYSYKLASETLYLNAGLSLQDDVIKNNRNLLVDKKTPAISLGISRILDKFTNLSCNFSYSWPSGYLSDPYKSIPVNERFTFIPNEIFMFEENRPDERKIYIFHTELSRYFNSLELGSHVNYRYFSDDSDLSGHTIEIELNKRLAESWVLSPKYRFYQQRQAFFYSPEIRKYFPEMNDPDSTLGPFYSADHRLSSFNSHTIGLKISRFINDTVILDAGYDRYLVNGRDKFTDSRVYPQADIFTIGLQWQF